MYPSSFVNSKEPYDVKYISATGATATLDNVIDETWFVTDVNECMENVSEIFREREAIYGCKPEVSQTLVGISALVQPQYKLEIKVIAYLG